MQIEELDMENSDYDQDGNLKPDAPPAQLYDLKSDPNQSINVYEKFPAVVSMLDKQFNEVKKR
jgi:hypothetical protein